MTRLTSVIKSVVMEMDRKEEVAPEEPVGGDNIQIEKTSNNSVREEGIVDPPNKHKLLRRSTRTTAGMPPMKFAENYAYHIYRSE